MGEGFGMNFMWSTPNSSEACNISDMDITNLEDVDVVLGRYQYHELIIGCCGQARYDSIFPVERTDFQGFKEEALRVIRDYNPDDNTPYSVEFFIGKPGQNFRGDGESLYLFIKEDDKWSFYENGKFKFSVTSVEELEKIWED